MFFWALEVMDSVSTITSYLPPIGFQRFLHDIIGYDEVR